MLDNIPYLPYFISAFIGIGLAAASGFRVFLPMFAVSLASYMGWIPINENFQWLAGLPTLITTGIATVVEILAYYIPYVDHLLDTASVPLATIAGSFMFAAQFTDLGTFPTWALALIAGGGTAAAISSGFCRNSSRFYCYNWWPWKFCSCHHRNSRSRNDDFFSFSSSRNCVFGSDCPCYCGFYFRKKNLE